MIGLWAAVIAVCLLLLQLLLGLFLKSPKLTPRRQVRRWHYFAMIAVIAFLGIHLMLNA